MILESYGCPYYFWFHCLQIIVIYLRSFYNNYYLLLEIIHDPVDDETEDTPLILAIKNFTSFLGPYDLTSDSPANLQVVKLLLDFGKLKMMYLLFMVR